MSRHQRTASISALAWILSVTILASSPDEIGSVGPQSCVVAWDATDNAFKEEYSFDLEQGLSPELHVFVCEHRQSRTCQDLQISLLPSEASTYCTYGTKKGTVQVITDGDPIIKYDFFGSNKGDLLATEYSNRCQGIHKRSGQTFYNYPTSNPYCTVSDSDTTSTAAQLFNGSGTSSDSPLWSPVFDSADLPLCAARMSTCLSSRNIIRWRTITSFHVDAPGTFNYQFRGFSNGEADFYSEDPEGTTYEFTVKIKACPPGTERHEDRSCVDCPVGKFKAGYGGTCAKCLAGKFGVAEGESDEDIACETCPAGKFGAAQGASSEAFCQDCEAGYYCPSDRLNNHSKGGTNPSSPLLCAAGRYGAQFASTVQCTGSCPAGFFCEAGTAIGEYVSCSLHPTCQSAPQRCYCASGTGQPALAGIGEYTFGSNGGRSDRMTSVSICSRGHYCVDGRLIPCGAGTYGSALGLSDAACTGLCEAGFFCPRASTSRQQEACGRDSGDDYSLGGACNWYCPEGTQSPRPVDSNVTGNGLHYSTPLTQPCTARESIELCPDDSICRNGVLSRRIQYSGFLRSCPTGEITAEMDEQSPGVAILELTVSDHLGVLDASDFSINSSTCLDTTQESDAFVIVQQSSYAALATASSQDLGSIHYNQCKRFKISFTANTKANDFSSTCTVVLQIRDTNDAPLWDASSLGQRSIPERSPRGTSISLGSDGTFIGGVRARDPDLGQEIEYGVLHVYPQHRTGAITVTKCGGAVSVQEDDLRYPETIVICVQACDDPDFFGSNSSLCAPITSCTNVTIVITNVNDPPSFTSTTNCDLDNPCTIAENSIPGTQVTGGNLGNAAIDADGDNLRWSLEPNGNRFSIDSNTGIIMTGSAMTDFESVHIIKVTVIVSDGKTQNCGSQWCPDLRPTAACCDKRQAQITVLNMNDAPVWPEVTTSLTFSVMENSLKDTLIGSPFFAVDEDFGDSLSYSVNDTDQQAKPRIGAITTSSGSLNRCQLVVIDQIDFESSNTINLHILANDTSGATATLSGPIIIVIDVNEPPTLSNISMTIGENTVVGTNILNTSVIIFSDPEENITGFRAPRFSIDETKLLGTSSPLAIVSSSISLQGAIDYESIRMHPQFIVPFYAIDFEQPSITSNTAYMYVTVVDENEPPVVEPAEFSISEFVSMAYGSTQPGVVVGTIIATDPDENIAAWKILDPFSIFKISSTGDLSVGDATAAQRINYEESARRSLLVRVFDTNNLTDDGLVIIHVKDENDLPVILTPSNISDSNSWLSISKHTLENGTAYAPYNQPGSLVATLAGSDEDADSSLNGTLSYSILEEYLPHDSMSAVTSTKTFEISSDGVISVAYISDGLRSEESVFRIVVRLHDHGSPERDHVKDFYINVTKRNFPPTFTSKEIALPEGPFSGSIVAIMEAEDPENTQILYSITSVLPPLRTSDGLSAFEIYDNANGSVSIFPGFEFDYETTKWFDFQQGQVKVFVEARDAGGATASAKLTIQITDTNEPPTMKLPPSGFRIREDAMGGHVIASSLPARDEDINDNVTYLLSHDKFEVHLTNGKLSVRPSATLNFEDVSSYDILIQVEDSSGLEADFFSKISVLDVNEPPSLSNKSVSIPESSAPGSTITTITALDPDHSTMTSLTISVEKSIPSSVNFTTAQASLTTAYLQHAQFLDFEGDNTFLVSILANDHGEDFPFVDRQSLSAHAFVHVSVTDVNDLTVDEIILLGAVEKHKTSGGEEVELFGTNMGPKYASSEYVQAFYGPESDRKRFKALNCTLIAPYGYAVKCRTAPGFGARLFWTVVIGQSNATCVSTFTSYALPVISFVENATSIPTVGGTGFRIHGKNFGPSSTLSGIFVEYGLEAEFLAGSQRRAIQCSVLGGSIEILDCISVKGSGRRLSWRVSFLSQSSELFFNSESGYARPIIESVSMIPQISSGFRLSTLGEERIRITGSNFGQKDTVLLIVVYGKYIAKNCRIAVDHTIIECETVPGIGSGLDLAVNVGPFGFSPVLTGSSVTSNNQSLQLSYMSPVINEVSGPAMMSAATSGDDTIIIRGRGFGPSIRCDSDCHLTNICTQDSSNPTASYAPVTASSLRYTAKCCEVLNDNQINCLTSQGTGAQLRWQLNVGGQFSSMLQTNTRYASPVIGSYAGDGAKNANTEGGEIVVLKGINFGPAGSGGIDSVTFGPVNGTEYSLSAKDCQVKSAHVEIECITPKGAGSNLKWILVIDGQKSSVPTTSYAKPFIERITGKGSSNASNQGGDEVYLHGVNFGPPYVGTVAPLEGVFYGPGDNPFRYEAKDCQVINSSTKIRCLTAAGAGNDLKWTVRVAGQVSQQSEVTTSYGQPYIKNVHPSSGPTQGGYIRVLEGHNFGTLQAGTFISIIEDNVEYDQGIRLLHERQGVKNLDKVEYLAHEGYGLNIQLKVRIYSSSSKLNFQDSNTILINYSLPEIFQVHVAGSEDSNGLVTDSDHYLLTVQGANFCPNRICAIVYLDNEIVPKSQILGHSHDRILLEASVTSGIIRVSWAHPHHEIATVEMIFRSISPSIDIDAMDDPACELDNDGGIQGDKPVTYLSCSGYNTTGGSWLTIYANQLGTNPESISVNVGGSNAVIDSLDLSSDPQVVTIRIPSGEGLFNDVQIISGNASSPLSGSLKLSYKAPVIESPNSNINRILNADRNDLRNGQSPRVSTKGAIARIEGLNFGRNGRIEFLRHGYVSGTKIEVISWTHFLIVVILPPGSGDSHRLAVHVAGQNAISSEFSYAPPVVTSFFLREPVSSINGTQGGDRIEIIGENFGLSARLFIGGKNCTVLLSNHTFLFAITPEGYGSSNSIMVEVGGATSNFNVNYVYPKPTISFISPTRGSTSGFSENGATRTVIKLTGQNFGSKTMPSSKRLIYFGSVDVSENIITANHSCVILHSPELRSPTKSRNDIPVRILVDGLSSTGLSPPLFSYDPPQISSIRVLSCSSAEGPSCSGAFPVPTDGCHDWSFPRQKVTSEETGLSSLNRIVWTDESETYYRSCVNPVYIELVGTSFGLAPFEVSVNGKYNSSSADCLDPSLCIHSHRKIVIRSPPGFGSPPMMMQLKTQGLDSNSVPWSYESPSLDYRGSCGYWMSQGPQSCSYPYNARGTPFIDESVVQSSEYTEDDKIILEIQGENFGITDPGDVSVVIGGRECLNAEWKNIHRDTGMPYLVCHPQEDIVGLKNATITAAGQTRFVGLEGEPFEAACLSSPVGDDGSVTHYFGKDGQLCSECPRGANCKMLHDFIKNPPPISIPGFYRLSLPTRMPDINAATDEIVQQYYRAVGSNGENRRCSQQQLMDPLVSPELVKAFPDAVVQSKCFDFVGCEPSSACTGNNNCAVGYQHLLHQCRAWDRANEDACRIDSIENLAECQKLGSDLNGTALIYGDGSIEGIEIVGSLPDNYKPSSITRQTCIIIGNQWILNSKYEELCSLKGGVMVSAEGQGRNRTCRSDEDCSSASGNSCSREHPENCARCEKYAADDGSIIGVCTCMASVRCAMCTAGGVTFANGSEVKGYFRQNNECVQCPDNPWLLILGFVMFIIVGALAGYILNKRKFNLAFVSIGVDYFQVLALFRNVKTQWPPQLLDLFNLLSVFMIDIDIAAPECIVPTLEYATKWWGSMLLPIFVGLALVGSLVFRVIYDVIDTTLKEYYRVGRIRCCKNSKDIEYTSYMAQYITFFYYAYILLAEKGLEVFNCNPTTPDDGFTYTEFTSDLCEGGLCRCYDPTQLQYQLVAPAVVLLVVYGLGFPIFVLSAVLKNKMLIKEDQLLRASGLGDSKETNPYAWDIRKKFMRLYYHFKPGKIYWIQYILARKIGIAFAGLFFRANPGFQLSFVLLILFASYVAQVKHRPYMSTSERIVVLEEHMMKVLMASELEEENMEVPSALKKHQIIAEHIRLAHEAHKKLLEKKKSFGGQRKRIWLKWSSKKDLTKDLDDEEPEDELEKAVQFFWDYNTVEQILLASAIIICISGIMFESDRFSGGENGTHFMWQREMITWLVMIVIAGSISYYMLVFLAEVCGTTPKCLLAWHHNKQKKKGTQQKKSKSVVEVLSAGNAKVDQKMNNELDQKMENETRQILLRRQMQEVKKKAEDAAQKIVDQERQKLAEERKRMHEKLKKNQDLVVSLNKNRSKKMQKYDRKPVRARKQFKKKKTNSFLTNKFGDMSKLVGDRVELDVNESAPLAREDESEEPVHLEGNWYRYIHPETKQIYYHDIETGESRWEDPTGKCAYANGAASFQQAINVKDSEVAAHVNPMLQRMRDAASRAKSREAENDKESNEKADGSKEMTSVNKWSKFKHLSVASRLKMAKTHQGELYKRQKAERKAAYIRGRAKANWRKASLAAIINKRKSEGDRKGAQSLAWRQTGFLARLKIQKAKEEAEEAARLKEKKSAMETSGVSSSEVEMVGLESKSLTLDSQNGQSESNQNKSREMSEAKKRKVIIDKRYRQATGQAPPPPKQNRRAKMKAIRRMSALRTRKIRMQQGMRRASLAGENAGVLKNRERAADAFGFANAIGNLKSKADSERRIGATTFIPEDGSALKQDASGDHESATAGTNKVPSIRRASNFASRLKQRASQFKKTTDSQRERLKDY